jgi:hypothetical protein
MSGKVAKMEVSPPTSIVLEPNAQAREPAWTNLTPEQTAAPRDSQEGSALQLLVQDVLAHNRTATDKFTNLFYPAIHYIATQKALQFRSPSFNGDDLAQWAWEFIVYGVRLGDNSTDKTQHPLEAWLLNQNAPPLRHHICYKVRHYSQDIARHMRRRHDSKVIPLTENAGTSRDPQLERRYRDCWSRLPEADRLLFDLVFIDGTSRPAVCKQLKISQSTLSRRLSDVRDTFATCLNSSSVNS